MARKRSTWIVSKLSITRILSAAPSRLAWEGKQRKKKKIAAYVAETYSKLFGKGETQKLQGKQESNN